MHPKISNNQPLHSVEPWKNLPKICHLEWWFNSSSSIFNLTQSTNKPISHQPPTHRKKIEIKRNHASPKIFTFDFVFKIQLLATPPNDQILPHMQMQSQRVSSSQIVGWIIIFCWQVSTCPYCLFGHGIYEVQSKCQQWKDYILFWFG